MYINHLNDWLIGWLTVAVYGCFRDNRIGLDGKGGERGKADAEIYQIPSKEGDSIIFVQVLSRKKNLSLGMKSFSVYYFSRKAMRFKIERIIHNMNNLKCHINLSLNH